MIRIRSVVVLLVLMLSTCEDIYSQIKSTTSQYFINKMSFNPAYAGSSDKFDVVALYRRQFSAFGNQPSKFLGSISSPIKNTNNNIGFSIDYDQVGPVTQYEVAGSYAYRLYTRNNYNISFGVRGGYFEGKLDFTQLDGAANGDPSIGGSNTLYKQVMFGVGTYLETSNMALGLSIPTLFFDNQDITADTNDFRAQFRTYFTAEYLIPLNKEFSLKPSGFLRYNSRYPIGFDINTYLIYNQMFWVGAGYREHEVITANLLFVMNQANFPNMNYEMRLGYSYDFNRFQLNSQTSGAHELILSFLFNRQYSRNRLMTVNPRSF